MNAILDATDLNRAVATAILGMDPAVSDGLQHGAKRVEQAAKAQHDYHDRTGALTRSIAAGQVTGAFYARGLEVDVTADAPGAAAIEQGARPHVITARHARALRFRFGGALVFRRSVNHPGNKPYKYLAGALERELDDVAADVLDGACEALRDAGFEIER